VTCLAFAPDGKTLATGGEDGQVLLWDIPPHRPNGAVPPQRRLAEVELEAQWEALASPDAAKAYQAILTLGAFPGQSVPFLAERYVPTPARRDRILRALAELDHDDFAVRDRASADLRKYHEVAEPYLRRAFEDVNSPERRRRLEMLLEPLEEPHVPARRLLRSRAAEVLEAAGTAEARQVLKVLSERR
jgi:hypothetical protein